MKKKGFFNLKLILIIFIIVLVVIASIFYIKDKLDDQELQSLNTTMLQIQAKIKVINERNKINNTSDYIGKDISEDELRKLNIENNGKVKLLRISASLLPPTVASAVIIIALAPFFSAVSTIYLLK